MRVLKVSVYLQAMKNIFYTIVCCLISLTSLAQSDFGYENPDGRDPGKKECNVIPRKNNVTFRIIV